MIQNANNNTVTVNGKEITIGDEPNLLELIRKAHIDLPTFCYHSELSVYGACRLCMVDIKGRGLVTSCSTRPEPGMVIKTHTEELREMRKIIIELLLANHDNSCPTCPKNRSCQLQSLAARLGINEIRYGRTHQPAPVDESTVALVRDPNKCVQCGDCVRFCHEVQGIGAIDFAYRGAGVSVMPAFGKELNQVECVYCGQCARVCPTGAITVKTEKDPVWSAINSSDIMVVAQIAPAVRVALAEHFGLEPGTVATGQIVAAMKQIGFDKIYDTSFAADLTVIEEGAEFIKRFVSGETLPQFTSCCPAWVKYAEQYYPSLLNHLSSCRSPQQMFGSLAREILPGMLKIEPEQLTIVSIMPCSAKKYEARREEFKRDNRQDVDYVLTTQELAEMIESAGIDFTQLEPESLDMPMGFKTGAGVIFGTSGGVSEAVLRYAVEQVNQVKLDACDFREVRGEENMREARIMLGGKELRIAIVHGLKEAGKLAERVTRGDCPYHLVEVMSCPDGCVGGAGQPVPKNRSVRQKRTRGLYDTDKMMQVHKSQDNPMIRKVYEETLGEAGSHKAHKLLHTHYQSRRRIEGETLDVITGSQNQTLNVSVCVGTSCHVRGSQSILRRLIDYVESNGLCDRVQVEATFCLERCGQGPNIMIGDTIIEHCTPEKAIESLQLRLKEHGVVSIQSS